MAAIAAVHAGAPSWEATDWSKIVGLYDLLVAAWSPPVVALNRAVAVGFADGPGAGLAALDALAKEPSYLAAAQADFLRRLGRSDVGATAPAPTEQGHHPHSRGRRVIPSGWTCPRVG